MPGAARKKTDTGSYHIMLRGIDRQPLFRTPGDYRIFLETIQECKTLSGFRVHAYCLMGNHARLLLRFDREDIGLAMKRIGVRFVQKMNRKYSRTGHLFQDRYRSEVVEDDAYFLNLVRYIHQNPVKANITQDASGYGYSSYRDYLSQEGGGLTDTGLLLGMIGREQFEALHREPAEGSFLDIPEEGAGLPDGKAASLICKAARIAEPTRLAWLQPETADAVICRLLEKGAAIRQIARLTGITKSRIEKISRRRKQGKAK